MREGYRVAMVDWRRRVRRSRQRWSRIRTAVIVCALSLLAAACLDAEVDFVVQEDGSGSITLTMRFSEEMLALVALAEAGADEEFCTSILDQIDMSADDPLGLELEGLDWRSEAVVEDGRCVVTSAAAWSSAESEEVLAVFAEDELPVIQRLDSGGWRFFMTTDGLEDEEASLDDAELAPFADLVTPTLVISATLPGKVVVHNADLVTESTYSWEVGFGADELPPALVVETAPSSSGLGPEAIGAIVAGIGLALAALVTLRRHQAAKVATSSGADAESTTAADNPPTASESSDGDQAGPEEALDG